MSTFKQSQQLGMNGLAVRVWRGAFDMVAGVGRSFAVGLVGLAEQRAIVTPAAQQANAAAGATRLLARAAKENSNLEVDWLWYAANMANDAQRRYCLERALAINPQSELAKNALAKLPPLSRS
jgi:hypothetical protein